MKVFVAVLVSALAVAASAVVLDSPLLVLLSVGIIGADVLFAFALGLRSALRAGAAAPYLLVVGAALAASALGVAAVVIGDRGDAPGLTLLGVATITSVVVGAVALGTRTAERTS
jgi:hypothetical protein